MFDFAPYLTTLGGGFGAGAGIAAGFQSADLLRANAQIAGLQGQAEVQAGAQQAEMYHQHLESVMGRQTAQVGGSGVTMSGSPLRALERTSDLGAQDIARIQLNAARKGWGFQVTQAGDEMRAGMASQNGVMGGIGSLITTGAKAYGEWGGID